MLVITFAGWDIKKCYKCADSYCNDPFKPVVAPTRSCFGVCSKIKDTKTGGRCYFHNKISHYNAISDITLSTS